MVAPFPAAQGAAVDRGALLGGGGGEAFAFGWGEVAEQAQGGGAAEEKSEFASFHVRLLGAQGADVVVEGQDVGDLVEGERAGAQRPAAATAVEQDAVPLTWHGPSLNRT
ncbi:hypothetical protein [Streptosporangium sp. G11]|uniref:hypothetical protein n=1 Tax=Streptosporangium sp. G11 TaxID=3436926 RepID=UPI003EBA7A0E